MRKRLVIGAAAVALTAAAAELSETEVDRLCPPRAETAAAFKAGAYPPAARPYRPNIQMGSYNFKDARQGDYNSGA